MRPAHQEILYARDHLVGRIVDFDDLEWELCVPKTSSLLIA